MARSKEAAVVVLDVGPHMTNYLPALRKSLFLLAETKLLNHPAHEVAVILYGTTETNNDVHKEMVAGGQEDEQYLHINTIQPLACPDIECLKKINSITCGRGTSDHVSALLVGLDLVKKAVAARKAAFRGKKRLLLIGTFDTEVEELDDEFRNGILEGLSEAGLGLEVYGVGDGAPARSDTASQQRASNLSGLHDLLAQVSGSYKALPREVDMAALFATKDTAPSASNMSLTIGSRCRIEVQLFKKTAKERPPSLKMYSPPTAVGGTGMVTKETEYRDPTDKDHVLAAEERTKGYRYGHQLVPVEDDSLLAYKTEKCLELVGFTDRANVPRWHYCEECHVMLGRTPGDALALSAVVQALAKQNKVAVIRCCKTSNVMLMAGTPMPAPATSLTQQDCLVLNRLPYKDDLRQLIFKDFGAYKDNPDKQHLAASPEQERVMQQLVANMRLAPALSAAAGLTQPGLTGLSQPGTQPGSQAPEDTLNPLMQRFYWFIGQRALDPQFQVPDSSEDLLAAAVLDQAPPDMLTAAARAALEALPKLFKITEAAAPSLPAAAAAAAAAAGDAAATGAAGALVTDEGGLVMVTEVDTAQPVETFTALLKHGQADKAFSGMQSVITQLVDSSTGERLFPKALEATQALRTAAVAHKAAVRFNDFLDKLRGSYKGRPDKGVFWRALMQAGTGPISEEEVQGVGVSKAEAQEYVRVHGAEQQPAPEAPKVEVMEVEDEEDEFAGME